MESTLTAHGKVVMLAMFVLASLLLPVRAQLPSMQTLSLWPEGHLPAVVEGGERIGREGLGIGAVSGVSNPRLDIYHPFNPNGTAMLVLGGGGYFRIQIGTAAKPIAQWLASNGVTAAVLYYRLPGDGWPPSAPFADGQRAMRLLRANAVDWGIDSERIGVLGSSAGANLAGILSTRFAHAFYQAVDGADQLSSRPTFVVMLYPVVTLRPPYDTTRSRRELGRQDDAVQEYSVELHVQADTPPVFLAHAADDPITDPGHSMLMFEAARAQGVPVELHLFDRGGHSWGLGVPDTQTAQWRHLFFTWAKAHGWMPDAEKVRP